MHLALHQDALTPAARLTVERCRRAGLEAFYFLPDWISLLPTCIYADGADELFSLKKVDLTGKKKSLILMNRITQIEDFEQSHSVLSL